MKEKAICESCMSVEDRLRWDTVFRQMNPAEYPAPDPFLLQFTPPLKDQLPKERKHRALDLAGGLGQNGLWLAEQGYSVDIMDISRVALHRARAEMGIRNLRNVNLLQTDVDDLELEPNLYELICVFRYLKRRLFSLLKLATKRGGRIIYETYNVRYLALVPQFNRDFLLGEAELTSYFHDWQVLYSDESSHVSRIVALKT